MNADTLVIFPCHLEYILLFLDYNMMKNVNNFMLTKGQPQGVLNICLLFCNFSLALLIKVLLIRKKRVK